MSARSSTILIPAVLVAAVCARLGFWQLSRLAERRAANARTLSATALPELNLNQGEGGAGRAERRGVARGTFDRSEEIVLRAFVYQGAPGVRIVTPLRLAGSDSAVLVLRGFVSADDAIHPSTDSTDEPGEREVRGVLKTIVSEADSGAPLVSEGLTTWRRLDLAALRKQIPYPVLDVYLIAERDSLHHGFPIRLEPPALDDGPHLSYALQWFGFGITALVVGGVIASRGRRET
ncbi:MAG TPA: SURF1 family protein [Gemmatimonadales bacterium]|nr:SURF1 family protein [Gemmatimonadales bacterium]